MLAGEGDGLVGVWRCFVFFFNDTATTEIYTLSLHDALPIYCGVAAVETVVAGAAREYVVALAAVAGIDRKSTRLNSSHANISYAVFCLKKKKKKKKKCYYKKKKQKKKKKQ